MKKASAVTLNPIFLFYLFGTVDSLFIPMIPYSNISTGFSQSLGDNETDPRTSACMLQYMTNFSETKVSGKAPVTIAVLPVLFRSGKTFSSLGATVL